MRNAEKAQRIKGMKGKEKITMLTAYDYSMAGLETLQEVDMILVGDSAHFVLNGRSTTRGIRMEEMVSLTERVARGVKDYGDFSLVVADMPAGSYDSIETAVKNARRHWQAGADAIKLEGGIEKPGLQKIIQAITQEGIPVQGHIGYTPQSEQLVDTGHYQGKTLAGINKLVDDCLLLKEAGVFSLVLECVPWQVAQHLTTRTSVPTIGIGAGPYCDGQVLVVYDLLGLTPGLPGKPGKLPHFVWQYDCAAPAAIQRYVTDVKTGRMPDMAHSKGLKDEGILKKILKNDYHTS